MCNDNVIDDETHFIFYCNQYNDLRKYLYEKIRPKYHRYGGDRFTVKLMISMSNRYANMLNRCAEDYIRLRNTLFFRARSYLKNLLIAFICVYFDQLYSQISPQNKISIANINKTRCLLSGIHLGDNFRHAREMCARDPKWLCP